MESLPDEILELIFNNFYKAYDLVSSSCVSKQWYRVARATKIPEYTITKYPQLADIYASDTWIDTLSAMVKFVPKRLKKVNIKIDDPVKRDIIYTSLSDKLITDLVLYDIQTPIPIIKTLRKLVLIDPIRISDMSGLSIEELIIDGDNTNPIIQLPVQYMPNLKSLLLYKAFNRADVFKLCPIEKLVLQGVWVDLAHFANLKSLITHAVVHLPISGLPDLNYIYLHNPLYSVILSDLYNLESFTVDCLAHTPLDIAVNNCTKVHVNIRLSYSTTSIQSNCIEYLNLYNARVKANIPNLKHLTLLNSDITFDNDVSYLYSITINHVDNARVKIMFNGYTCSDVKNIYIRNADIVIDKTVINRIKYKFPNLEYIEYDTRVSHTLVYNNTLIVGKQSSNLYSCTLYSGNIFNRVTGGLIFIA
jgi:hypothetical protein